MQMGIGIIEGISAAKTGIELTRIVRDLLKRDKIDRAEMEGRISEIQCRLADAREALNDALEENRALKDQLAENSRIAELEQLMVFEQSVRWKRISLTSDEVEPDPYCPL